MKTKVCTKCGESKGLGEYYKHKYQKSGLRSQCKICTNKSTKRYAQENKEKVAKKNKLYAVQSVALSYDCALESGDSLIITRHTGELIFFSVDILESNSHAMRLSKSEIISEMGEDFYLSLNEKKYYYASSDEIYFNKQSSQCKSLVKI